jgi:bis(5'-nucleosyl)-tetraphosphatase (symmetrical)
MSTPTFRTLFIGDVHGCPEELEKLIARFAPEPGDRLYQTGDLINKGYDSLGAARLAMEKGIQCVLGNHEAKLLELVQKPEKEWTEKNKYYMSQLGDFSVASEIAEVVRHFPLWLDTGTHLLVHAGLEPGKSRLEEMDRSVLLTVRHWEGRPWYAQTRWPDRVVVFGHWALGGLVDLPHAKGLDTGCVYGRLLTGYCPEEERFYQVANPRVYRVY